MERVLAVHDGVDFLGGRSGAFKLRTKAELILRASDDCVVLDFARVSGVSHSFADELLSSLSEALGEATHDRVVVRNCSAEVFDNLQSVADMHQLYMPKFEGIYA